MGCQKFEFGEQKPFINDDGDEAFMADLGLVASCAWTISGPDGFELGHWHLPPIGPDGDILAEDFYDSLETNPQVVQTVHIDSEGSLSFELTGGFRLQLVPTADAPSTDHTFWMFLPGDSNQTGLQCDENGLDWV